MAINPHFRDELANIIREAAAPERKRILDPVTLKTLALELAATMPPAPEPTLKDVLAGAFALDDADRAVVENYMRASRLIGLDLEPESVRKSTDEDVRALWSKGVGT